MAPIENPHLFDVIPNVISKEENQNLTRKLEEVEIFNTLKEMAQDFSPRFEWI